MNGSGHMRSDPMLVFRHAPSCHALFAMCMEMNPSLFRAPFGALFLPLSPLLPSLFLSRFLSHAPLFLHTFLLCLIPFPVLYTVFPFSHTFFPLPHTFFLPLPYLPHIPRTFFPLPPYSIENARSFRRVGGKHEAVRLYDRTG